VDETGSQIAGAAESYAREAAIVDARLSREVSCAFKATALSDLCDRLRRDTGILVAAGSSVADEKVTLFCGKSSLRDVMRQISRPFGYTWLRTGKEKEYRYELVQDLRSQLQEEELRNRDRHAALLALESQIERYRRYMDLSPEEALARARTAAPGEKEMLENVATMGWGPLQVYFRLSPRDLAALRSGQTLKFGPLPFPDWQPLPAEVSRGVLERWRHERFVRREERYEGTDAGDANGLPLSAIPEARGLVDLTITQSELGAFTFTGASGFSLANRVSMTRTKTPLAIGQSPRVLQPDNRQANARLAQDPALRARISVAPQGTGGRVTTADVLEALHRASGLPVVADYYTRLYAPPAVKIQNQPLFEMLNQLADRMRVRWSKDGGWLQFRTTSYYDDRLKEVPNRLLARWSAARKEHGVLRLEDLVEIAQLPDAQLDANDMAEGARVLYGLEEWDLARGRVARSHLRYLGSFTPDQRQAALGSLGLPFTRMSLAQQQEYINVVFVRYSKNPNATPNVHLEDLRTATLRVTYARTGEFEWRPTGAGGESDDRFRVRGPTREATLTAARRVDPQATPAQIVPAERALTFAYLRENPETGLQGLVVRATDKGGMIHGPQLPSGGAGGK